MSRWLAGLGIVLLVGSAEGQVFKPRDKPKPSSPDKSPDKSADKKPTKADKSADKSDADTAPATDKATKKPTTAATSKRAPRGAGTTSRRGVTKPSKSRASKSKPEPDDLTPSPAAKNVDPDFVEITDDD